MSLDKRYNHQEHEQKIYQLWEKNQAFNPDSKANQSSGRTSGLTSNQASNQAAGQASDQAQPNSSQDSYTIIMPPPNANDPLHMGHAMFVAIEDALIRFHRMLGQDTLWLPGTDHAGIETQYVFEKKLKKQGKSRFDFDRETLYQKIWDYVKEKSDVAVDQIKKLGASADWSRFKFTLDEDVVDDVLSTFEKLEKKGLIYRANRLVNYCTKCGTGFSELEIEHIEQKSPLYYLKYGPLTVATTRPETKFSDVALAVHPDDNRYQKYIGKSVKVEGLFEEFELPVIADEFVDPEFGTGVVKITPHHDKNDFEFYQRHKEKIKRPAKKSIDFQGKMTAIAGKYRSKYISVTHEALIKDLKKAGLLVKTDENYKNTLGVCYRCKNPIEPLPLTQFYIKVKPLVEPVIKALDNNQIRVFGAGHKKILRHWLEILEDWNISRQVVWGIRIPVWYKAADNPDTLINYINPQGENLSGKLSELLENDSLKNIKQGLQTLNAPIKAKYKISRTSPGEDYLQETDTFDTWFSSSQWPFVTLKNTQDGDFERFYPTQLMETAYDILMFWVMRMLMMGKFATGKFPFDKIYLHGLIRDEKGQKMSKSKGNVINPLDITEEYGTDALRLALVIRSSAGLDKSVGKPDFKAGRNLTNKMWNATRFILMNLDRSQKEAGLKNPSCQDKEKELDQKFQEKLNQVVKEVTRQLEHYKLGLAAETLYNEFWHWYCDQGIEQHKNNQLSDSVLLEGLTTFLKLFHPFMPFITEVLWQELVDRNYIKSSLLINSSWPE